MVASVCTRACACAVACALALGAGSARGQEASGVGVAVKSTAGQPEKSTPQAEQNADSTEPLTGEEVKADAGSAALPSLVVDSAPPKKTTNAKPSRKTSAGAPAVTPEQLQTQVPGVVFGQALSDTGMTTYDSGNVNLRSDGGGDANSFLRNLPNVQYQNDTDTDAGVNLYELIDTRPLEVSINGARVYENNFILNGVSINSVAGPEPFPVDDLEGDSDEVPNLNGFYGVHSQTVFVPSDFVGKATVIDSNASAEYGEFQGGVVIYDLAKPPTDRYRASVTYNRQTDDMVNYILATPTGTNPLSRTLPTFTRENLAASVGAPITTDLSFILQASRKTAETTRQKKYEMYDERVRDDSENTFVRFATALNTDIGRFTLDTSLTDYSQLWQSPGWRNLAMDVETQSSTTQIEYLGALPGIAAPLIGLGDVTLKSRAYYNDSNTGNYTNSDVAYAHIARRSKKVGGVWAETFSTDDYSDWCRAVPDSATATSASQNNTICYEGGYGNKEMGQTDLGWMAQLRSKLLAGSFLVGGEAKSIEGRRARIGDFTYYSSYATATGETSSLYNPPAGAFDCVNADNCNENQFARTKLVNRTFDIAQTVNALNGYAEVDQTFGMLNVRAGARLDYEDYFKNINIAPRVAGTITPFDGLSFTGGYNRYYLGQTLAYALRDSQPFSETWTRRLTAGTSTPADWVAASTGRRYTFSGSDLETPFTDEYTGAVRIRDPLLGGLIRLKYVERYGRDQFSSADCGTNCLELTNDGERFYRSASAEYSKFWRTPSLAFLSGAGINTGITWSEQSISRATFFDTDESDVYILYNGQSYTPESFTAVTGNLDIPVRIGATLATSWFEDRLSLALSAGYNLGYQGVYDTGGEEDFNGRPHAVYEDRVFDPVLQIDLLAEVAITEQAYISARVNNVFNTAGNLVSTNTNPWVAGRSVWIESGLRF